MTDKLRKAVQAYIYMTDGLIDGNLDDAFEAMRDAIGEAPVGSDLTPNATIEEMGFDGIQDRVKIEQEHLTMFYDPADFKSVADIPAGMNPNAERNAIKMMVAEPRPIDALIADAIEKHDAKMLEIRTVNMRKNAQPYLDELIAEIDKLTKFRERFSDVSLLKLSEVQAILDKWRAKP